MSRITVTASDLTYVLKSTAPFRSKDSTLPVLTCTALTVESHGEEWTRFGKDGDGPVLRGVATDRFKVGCAEVGAHLKSGDDGYEEGAEVGLVSTDQAKVALTWLATFEDAAPVRVDLVKHGFGVKVTLTVHPGHSDESSLSLKVMEGEFPYLGSSLLPAIEEKITPTSNILLGPDHLKAVCDPSTRYEKRDNVLLVQPGSTTRPIGFVIGDHFAGCIMPRRQS